MAVPVGTVIHHATFRVGAISELLSSARESLLRPGNVSSADDWDELLVPEIDRQQAQGKRVAMGCEIGRIRLTKVSDDLRTEVSTPVSVAIMTAR